MSDITRAWRTAGEAVSPLYLSVETSQSTGEVVVALVGDCDLATGPALGRRVAELLRLPVRFLTLDLEGLAFVDSSGLAALDNVRRAAEAAGVVLRMRSVPAQALQVLEITDMLRLFVVEPSTINA